MNTEDIGACLPTSQIAGHILLQDTPVFLPVKSPTVPFRLVSSELSAVAGVGVTVCVLCGPSPSLVEIETELLRNWKTTYNLVASLQSLHPRGFPAQANFDHVSTTCCWSSWHLWVLWMKT